MKLSRRSLLAGLGAWSSLDALAAPQRGRVKITGIRTVLLQGPRTYTLVKVLTDSGVSGIGEGFGSPGVGIKEGIAELTPYFVGKDPLEIEPLYNGLGSRTDGSAHMLLRAVSAIECALWDIAGKLLGVPVSTLLGGRYRERVRLIHEEGPRDMLSQEACREWADKIKTHAAGWTAIKLAVRRARDAASRTLTPRELRDIRQGFENCRAAVGLDYDLIVHCGGAFDLGTAIQLAQAVEPVKPLWMEDPMPADYSSAWLRLTEATPVSIVTGHNLARRPGFRDFIVNHGCDVAQIDVRNAGGLLESKKIGDMADTHYVPMCAQATGSLVCATATAQWAAAVRDFTAMESIAGRGNWMDDVILREGPVVKDGQMAVSSKPGLGFELNSEVVKANLARGEKWWD